ncbi:sugar phosphate isomerase/epimerase family protein [Paenibacillus sp. HJGM_3]|uniref:sugar phosphate isomerase/epimerase family protein n=1 Tax=Paenibacillus sp. HJGM_3 TaxID=3379816 RepID=UPI00385C1921
MKLGMPTLVEYRSIEENVRLCNALGLDFIELNMNLPICIPEQLSAEQLRGYKEKYRVDFIVHLPEELDVASCHPSIRRGHLERCRQTMEWASAAGIRTLNMHLNPGIYFTLPHQKVWIHEQYETLYTELLHEAYTELYKWAEAYRVELCIENTGNFHMPFVRKTLELLSGFQRFALTWDVGHDAKAGFVEESTFTRLYPSRIRHMHLHDYNGKSDHQPLYTGIVPIDDRLALARKENWSVVIEVKTSESLTESAAALRTKGYLPE